MSHPMTATIPTAHVLAQHQQQQQSQVASTAASQVERPWKEYTDATTGTKYYSNGITSSWTKPPEMIQAETQHQSGNEPDDDSADPQTKRPKIDDKESFSVTFASKEDALQAFQKLLADRDVTPTQKWGEVVKLFDSAKNKNPKQVAVWDACENALTNGEQKQAFAEYQTKLAKDLRNKERQDRLRIKEGFLKLLSDTVAAAVKARGLNIRQLRLEDLESDMIKDDRYQAIPEDSTREEIFAEFMEEYGKREERRKQTDQREAQNSFLDFCKELYDKKLLHSDAPFATWEAFTRSLSDERKGDDARFKASWLPLIVEDGKTFLFQRFLDDMKVAEDEARIRAEEESRQAAIAQRDFFRNILVRLAQEGKVVPSSNFVDLEPILRKEESFEVLLKVDSSRPKELFEDFVNSWNETYRDDRIFLSQVVRKMAEETGMNIKEKATSYELFCSTLKEASSTEDSILKRVERIIENEFNPVPSSRLYFNELQQSSSGPRRRASQLTNQIADDSSEDEGEIAEDD